MMLLNGYFKITKLPIQVRLKFTKAVILDAINHNKKIKHKSGQLGCIQAENKGWYTLNLFDSNGADKVFKNHIVYKL
jgi:hypothetical protein